jgi:hypothetical protein
MSRNSDARLSRMTRTCAKKKGEREVEREEEKKNKLDGED